MRGVLDGKDRESERRDFRRENREARNIRQEIKFLIKPCKIKLGHLNIY
jgi:hypothetical protein